MSEKKSDGTQSNTLQASKSASPSKNRNASQQSIGEETNYNYDKEVQRYMMEESTIEDDQVNQQNQGNDGRALDSNLSDSKKPDESYKNDQYWALPENVRNAIDVAKMKSKHSEFYYRL